MARVLQQLVEPPHACAYLPAQSAQLEVRVMIDVTPDELEAMLERGWRRFGPAYFRPACRACVACDTLRIPTARFRPSKSQRRAAKNAARLVRTASVPVVDEERLALYRRWHARRELDRGWDESTIDEERYAFDFAFPHPSVREITFRDPATGRLVGVGICDETPRALSAVYFFWDPEHAPASLGVANVVALVEDARARSRDHVYLGYRVEGCPSLTYKGAFRPHELLRGRPAEGEPARWEPMSLPEGPEPT